MKSLIRGITALLVTLFANIAQPMENLKISSNGRFFATESGQPYFVMADTVWELIHFGTYAEIEEYLDTRKNQGFNTILTSVMAPLGGVTVPTPEGFRPLYNNNPTTPIVVSGDNNDFWDKVKWVLDEAAERNLYIGLFPTWGDSVGEAWDSDPQILNTSNARTYGSWLAYRYKDHKNIIWFNGGDRSPWQGYEAVWHELGTGIRLVDTTHLMSYHPAQYIGSGFWWLEYWKNTYSATWLDFNGFQSGHDGPHNNDRPPWVKLAEDYNRIPAKPVMELEPRYEDHAIVNGSGYWLDKDARNAAYWTTFAGGCGHTYGHAALWQWYDGSRPMVGSIRNNMTWRQALLAEGGKDMVHLKNLMLSRPYFLRTPAQNMLLTYEGWQADRLQATRGDGFAFVYSTNGRAFAANTSLISGTGLLNGWWYNPRDGYSTNIGKFARGSVTFTPPSYGIDWVLVLDDEARGFTAPGIAFPTPMHQWKYNHFGTTEISDNDDAEHDGFANIVEYAFGMNPNVANKSRDAFVPTYSPTSITLTYNENNDSRLTYIIESSINLVNWQERYRSSGAGINGKVVSIPTNGARSMFVRFKFLYNYET